MPSFERCKELGDVQRMGMDLVFFEMPHISSVRPPQALFSCISEILDLWGQNPCVKVLLSCLPMVDSRIASLCPELFLCLLGGGGGGTLGAVWHYKTLLWLPIPMVSISTFIDYKLGL